MEEKIYDIIGIGIGPFNLGMAAMLEDVPEISSLFLDENEEFNFHPGLLLPTARMQVPYYADLVTIANPQSRFTFHNFLYEQKRFFRFANQENNYPLRTEYNEYLRWAAKQLPNLKFNQHVTNISFGTHSNIYTVQTPAGKYYARNIVLGTGEQPHITKPLLKLEAKRVVHSSNYLHHQHRVAQADIITIIGSGQSAAEIFLDLLPVANDLQSLNWFTRSSRFHPMDVSRFTTEMTSGAYIDHFFRLNQRVRDKTLKSQQYLYKGINAGLLEQINEALYTRMVNGGKNNVTIAANMKLVAAMELQWEAKLTLRHVETRERLNIKTDMVVAATGYHYREPACLAGIEHLIKRSADGRFDLDRDHSIDERRTVFVQNAGVHTHGFNTADLALGPYRNAEIINSILKTERFALERETGFQQFKVA
ncbi:MAG: SidA/IucD/PvdA family monooxygenase [Chitinophagaceae bacterium]|nr:SidA/IucD/PvdA family monooxygenase [Chitinophagaceae bacterium]